MNIKKNIKKTIACAVFALASHSAFADVASDYSNPNIPMDKVISNALSQSTPLTTAEIVAQLQAAGVDSITIEITAAALIVNALNCTDRKTPEHEELNGCQKLSPELVADVLIASYAALEKLNAGQPEYDQLTKTVYSLIPVGEEAILATIGETVLGNPNVDPTLATAPTAAGGTPPGLTAPPAPPPPGGSGGGGAASPS
ncbi:hypothetical protein [sulfur-oxidizing endosymbiont of Gigantopelta aegis]|uniref:hypothetical protein n=1 Tax=sulfur-oxidizing endosymbiont of Gigantopelta aegis TaxID=2794934 RepID=UPI0018DCA279|nr:hypothetical protein [sulfur-oxidizing endosymbiont of Gigantopelta aegis]